MQQVFMCDYCPNYKREVLTEEEAIEHEKTCVWNPQNKSCWTCKYDGTVYYETSDSMGKSFTQSTRGCTANHRSANSNMIMYGCGFYKLETYKDDTELSLWEETDDVKTYSIDFEVQEVDSDGCGNVVLDIY